MNQLAELPEIRLTQFAHGGGCGCKIAPAALREILSGMPLPGLFPDLLVGVETADDAAVYRLNDHQALVATTDFFLPVVDDAYDFGRIAATNALSDVYAMGARPILALAIVGMPVNKLPAAVIRRVIAGGAAVCAEISIPIAGGHSIDSLEPIYGLVALGLTHPDKIKRNAGGQAGDVLVLGKGLGVGIMSAALRKDMLSVAAYAEMLTSTTQLNTPGLALADMPGVHALTDVTGFGLLGHLLEVCRGSGVAAEVSFDRLPVLSSALPLAQQGLVTGASTRNWESYADEVSLPAGLRDWQRNLLTDPQTSGGLLVACAPQAQEEVLGVFRSQGFAAAAVIGHLVAGEPRVRVR